MLRKSRITIRFGTLNNCLFDPANPTGALCLENATIPDGHSGPLHERCRPDRCRNSMIGVKHLAIHDSHRRCKPSATSEPGNWSVSIAIVRRNMCGRTRPAGISSRPVQWRSVLTVSMKVSIIRSPWMAVSVERFMGANTRSETALDATRFRRFTDLYGMHKAGQHIARWVETASATAMASATGAVIHQCFPGRPGCPLSRDDISGALKCSTTAPRQISWISLSRIIGGDQAEGRVAQFGEQSVDLERVQAGVPGTGRAVRAGCVGEVVDEAGCRAVPGVQRVEDASSTLGSQACPGEHLVGGLVAQEQPEHFPVDHRLTRVSGWDGGSFGVQRNGVRRVGEVVLQEVVHVPACAGRPRENLSEFGESGAQDVGGEGVDVVPGGFGQREPDLGRDGGSGQVPWWRHVGRFAGAAAAPWVGRRLPGSARGRSRGGV
jgi:hypothetical protein